MDIRYEYRCLIINSPSIAERLPMYCNYVVLLFDSMEAERLQSHKQCNYSINLKRPEEQLRMGLIYRLSEEEEGV